MRTNVKFDNCQFTTIKIPYQESNQHETEWLTQDVLLNFNAVQQPDLPRPKTGTLRLYQSRLEMRVVGRLPARAALVKRGAVSYEFSRKSRRRLMNAFHSWQVPDGWRRYHVILTYPASFSDDWQEWKTDLKAFKRKIQAVFAENVLGYWRLELQKRRAPHYHLFFALPRGFVTSAKLKKLITKWWATIAHKSDKYEGKYATKTITIRNDAMAAFYISKYCAKMPDKKAVEHSDDNLSLSAEFERQTLSYRVEQLQAKSIGRHWGRIGRPNEAPIAEIQCSPKIQEEIKTICALWVQTFNPRYSEKIQNCPAYVSYNVYGIKGIAWLLAYPRSISRPPP